MQGMRSIFSDVLLAGGDRILCPGIKALSMSTEPEMITAEEATQVVLILL